MRYRFSVFLTAAAICLAGAAHAKSIGYECTLKPAQQKGWLPEVLFIGHDPDAKQVVVSDPIILYYNNRQPLDGRVVTDNAKRITFGWKLLAKSNTNQRVRMSYKATYLKGSGEITLSGTPLGYADTFHAKGSCTLKALK